MSETTDNRRRIDDDRSMMRRKSTHSAATLDDLADQSRWVAWREEKRNAGKKPTKVPYDPNSGQRAQIPTDPSTWGTREEARRRWREMDDGRRPGGIGVVLGELNDKSVLMGIDLDGCIDPKSNRTETWAEEVLNRFNTYAEVSPSGEGIKLFFLVPASELHDMELLLPKTRKPFSIGKHLEMAIDRARFYAVTDDWLENPPKTLRMVDLDDVRWFVEEAGPKFLQKRGVIKDGADAARPGLDLSGSGYGFRFMQACKMDGDSYDRCKEKILADQGKAGEWARRVEERQLSRAWNSARVAPKSIHSWEEPDRSLLDDRRGTLPEFPLKVIEPEWLRDWIERAGHGTGTTIDHVAVPFLGIASAMIGTSRRVEATTSWIEPMTCWAAIIGFSGTGKTPGIDATRKPLAQLECEREEDNANLRAEHDERMERAKVANSQWKDQVADAVELGEQTPPKPTDAFDPGDFVEPRLFTTDATIERLAVLLQARPSGMLMLTDELAGWFLNMSRYSGGSDQQFWLQAWDGRPHVVERMKRAPIKLPHLLVGVVGGLQPDRLAQVFEGPADGMYARFLFSWPEEPPYRELADTVEEIEPKIVKMLNTLSRLPERTPCSVNLTAKAREEFECLRLEVDRQKKLLDGREREWWAKVPSQVLRLAGTLAFTNRAISGGAPPSEIKVQYVAAAVDLMLDYFWPHARAALRQVGLTQKHSDAKRVLRWIIAKRKLEISREEIRREALTQRLDANATQALLGRLEGAGWLRKHTTTPGPTGGRPPARWLVNELLLDQVQSGTR